MNKKESSAETMLRVHDRQVRIVAQEALQHQIDDLRRRIEALEANNPDV